VSAPLSVADVLERAADLIGPEGAWTQGAYARTADAEYLDAGLIPSDATCFCAAGAIARVAGSAGMFSYADRVGLVAGFGHGTSIIGWNDDPERTQAEVVAKLREAAALARTEDAR